MTPGAFACCVVATSRGIGSGFAFLQPRWIVTAKHVVAGDGGAVRVVFGRRVARPARVAFADPRLDLAVLELIGEPPCPAALLPGDGRRPATGLVCVGYRRSPGGRAPGEYRTYASAVPWCERSRRHRDGYEEDLFIFPAPDAEPGHSGGPLLTRGGTVIGVVTDGITLAGQHLLRATSIEPLRERLAGGGA